MTPYSLVRQNNDRKTHWVLIAFVVRVNPIEVKINEPGLFPHVKSYIIQQ